MKKTSISLFIGNVCRFWWDKTLLGKLARPLPQTMIGFLSLRGEWNSDFDNMFSLQAAISGRHGRRIWSSAFHRPVMDALGHQLPSVLPGEAFLVSGEGIQDATVWYRRPCRDVIWAMYDSPETSLTALKNALQLTGDQHILFPWGGTTSTFPHNEHVSRGDTARRMLRERAEAWTKTQMQALIELAREGKAPFRISVVLPGSNDGWEVDYNGIFEKYRQELNLHKWFVISPPAPI